MGKKKSSFFTEFTFIKAVLYGVASIYVILVSIAALAEPFLELPCDGQRKSDVEFPNVAYTVEAHLCRQVRYRVLGGLCRDECIVARRLAMAVLLGALIGWERRQADRPAGIRTMSIVSLGSCLFTINSTFAFLDGPMTWDSSRVSAAIPSGVGFMGAGLIFKKEERNESGDPNHVVHGLTTAASLWISAAVGVACGGGLYFPASFGVALLLLMLRFAPRGMDENSEDDESGDEEEIIFDNMRRNNYSATDISEAVPLSNSTRGKSKSIRNRTLACVD